jgi:uncharacterized protein YecE (DUF72 family)
MRPARIRIGISGWRYAPWRGTFYPKGLPQRSELKFASALLSAIEINGSFYALQKPASYALWYEQTPEDFVFAIKGSRYISHFRRLGDVRKPLANFFASGILNLREKLGPILWQFPPNFEFDESRMQAFLDLLPLDTAGAAALARKRDAFMKGRASFAIDESRALRYAVEIRNDTFLVPPFIDLLRKYNVAAVIAETARKWPMVQDITADFIYMRLHGDKEIYRSGYSNKSLQRWALRIAQWHRGTEPADACKVEMGRKPPKRRRDVYCFFDNTDLKLRAPFDARSLAKKLGVSLNRPDPGAVP